MRTRMIDSYSDGMYGWVIVQDINTGNKVRVAWSVTDPEIQSQHEALDRAEAALLVQRAIQMTAL